MKNLVLVLHDIRSGHNVGSLLRTAEGLGVSKVYMTGYTPYPVSSDDQRLPHIAAKNSHEISKTALGAEKNIKWQHHPDIEELILALRQDGYTIASLEQDDGSIDLGNYQPPDKLALLLGNELAGISRNLLKSSDIILEIVMNGKKESLNVSVAGAIAMYSLLSTTIK